ncbi:MAG: response regulator [Deltaproteobacteria bacterium]|nr:response regulator [Deltaproteobacteria bacterium]
MNNRIIVIDDEESILNDYIMILAPEGESPIRRQEIDALEAELFGETSAPTLIAQERYDVVTAGQGREGFEKVKQSREAGEPFALAFVDIRMPPGWDGLQTAKMIREIDKDIELVIVTAYSDRDRREIVAKVGTPERLLYIKKPFDPDEIRQLALALTKKWDLERKAERHAEYLSHLLDSVRRLKTISMSSMKEVLAAILGEVLSVSDAHKGFIARIDRGKVRVEIASEELLSEEIDSLIRKASEKLNQVDGITWINGIMIFPLENAEGTLFMLVSDAAPSKSEERVGLLKLLLETSVEVLENVRKHEHYVRSQRIATIGQIAAGIIHEINNPLAGIVGAAEMSRIQVDKLGNFCREYEAELSRADHVPEVAERLKELYRRFDLAKIQKKLVDYHEIIQAGGNRVRGLMGNIRSFSRCSDVFAPEIQDVGPALEDTLRLAQNSLRQGITVHREWTTPLLARCDLDSLKQVFLNLILNAAQAMHGSGELWIKGWNESGKAMITITDSGPGIPEEDQCRIFEAFYTTKADGTGLGMSIVKGIIEKHRGTITVTSQPGQGAAFHLEIPAE